MTTESVRSVLRKGDEVIAYSDPKWRTALLSGTVKAIGRVNVKLRTCVRFSPSGPWHEQEHTVPISAISVAARGEEILFDRRKEASRRLMKRKNLEGGTAAIRELPPPRQREPKLVREMKKAIDTGWSALDRRCERSTDLSNLLSAAFDIAVTQERAHRGFGRSIAPSSPPYRLSLEYAAKAIVLHHFYQGAAPPKSWQDFVHVRRDCALAYALQEAVGDPKLLDLCKAAWAIDYAEDIAG